MPSPPANLPEMIAKYSGNLSFIANSLLLPRSQLTDWVNADASLRKCLRDAREEMVDIAESALKNAMLEGQSWAVTFALKTAGRERGFGDSGEVSGVYDVGDAVPPELLDLGRLTDEQLDELDRLLTLAAGGAEGKGAQQAIAVRLVDPARLRRGSTASTADDADRSVAEGADETADGLHAAPARQVGTGLA